MTLGLDECMQLLTHFRQLREEGIGAEVKHASVVTKDEENVSQFVRLKDADRYTYDLRTEVEVSLKGEWKTRWFLYLQVRSSVLDVTCAFSTNILDT